MSDDSVDIEAIDDALTVLFYGLNGRPLHLMTTATEAQNKALAEVINSAAAMVREIKARRVEADVFREAIGRAITETNWCPICDAHPHDGNDHRDECLMRPKGPDDVDA